MSVDNIIKLCRHLDLSIDWLLTGEGEMTPPSATTEAWASRFRADAESCLAGRTAELSSIFQMLADACHPVGLQADRRSREPLAVTEPDRIAKEA